MLAIPEPILILPNGSFSSEVDNKDLLLFIIALTLTKIHEK